MPGSTVIVEPDPGGHHFQAVANVAAVASRTGPVVLLTARGVREVPAFDVFLADVDLDVREVYDENFPPTATMLDRIVEVCAEQPVATVVVMDADQSTKRWWYLAPRRFRRLPRAARPRVVFMLTRYPARLRLTDWVGWRLRGPKGALIAAARLTGSLDRAAGFAGRDDTATGWLVKRTRDPDLCSAHSRDRAEIRADLGLPLDRRLVGVFGVLSERRNVPLIWEAMRAAHLDADLLLAGKQEPDVKAWVAQVEREHPGRVTSFDGFLPNDLIDRLVAASDVAPIALSNNGPSGIMGKAIAAGVPVVSAGSVVRAREVEAAGAGEVAELDAASLGAAMGRVLDRDPDEPWVSRIPPATAEEFARSLLGVDEHGVVVARGRRPARTARPDAVARR